MKNEQIPKFLLQDTHLYPDFESTVKEITRQLFLQLNLGRFSITPSQIRKDLSRFGGFGNKALI
jgi:NADH/NAD ratio-sensing transcriptional regulator Rex